MKRTLRLNAKAPEHGTIFAPGTAIQINADASLPEWIQIAPFGNWPTRDKKAVQVFNAAAAEQIISWFNFWPQRLARLARLNAIKVYVGHPDFAPAEWPERIDLGSIVELNADENGLNARIKWSDDALSHVSKHKFPSVAWDVEVNADGTESPVMLWSVGMWHKPNIKSVQPVINAAGDEISIEIEIKPAGASESPETETNNEDTPMLNKIMEALKAAGIVKADDNEDTILGAIGSMIQSLAYQREEKARQEARASEIRTALNAVADVADVPDTELATVTVTQINALAAERATLNERINALTAEAATHRAERINALVERLIETGRITKADEAEARVQLNADPVQGLEALLAKPVQLGGKSLNLGKEKPAISDMHTRISRVNAEVERLMTEKRLSYDEAFKLTQANKDFAECFPTETAA